MKAHLNLLRKVRGLGLENPRIETNLTDGGLQVTVRAVMKDDFGTEIKVVRFFSSATVSRMWHIDAIDEALQETVREFEDAVARVSGAPNESVRSFLQKTCGHCGVGVRVLALPGAKP